MNKARARNMAQDADESLARAAHLYYMLGLTQADVAKRLGITRFKVHRLLAQARAQGMVRIEIDVPFAARLELEVALVNRFGLSAAFVCPSEDSREVTLADIIGQYAATVCAELLNDGQTIAMSWGATLRALALGMDPQAAQNLSVISMIGSLSTRSNQDKFEAASVLAERLKAECFYLPGPMFCDSIEAKKVINAQPAVQEVMNRARAADVALLSVGGEEMNSLRDAGILVETAYESAVDAGAIGNFLGRFIKADGMPADHELNRVCIGIGPDDIGAIPERVLCAGGEDKVSALHALLRRAMATVLVTDQATATALLDRQD